MEFSLLGEAVQPPEHHKGNTKEQDLNPSFPN